VRWVVRSRHGLLLLCQVISASSQRHRLIEGHRPIANSLVHKLRLSLVCAERGCASVVEASSFGPSDCLRVAPGALDHSGRHLREVVIEAILGASRRLRAGLLAHLLADDVAAEIAQIVITSSILRGYFFKWLNQENMVGYIELREG